MLKPGDLSVLGLQHIEHFTERLFSMGVAETAAMTSSGR